MDWNIVYFNSPQIDVYIQNNPNQNPVILQVNSKIHIEMHSEEEGGNLHN